MIESSISRTAHPPLKSNENKSKLQLPYVDPWYEPYLSCQNEIQQKEESKNRESDGWLVSEQRRSDADDAGADDFKEPKHWRHGRYKNQNEQETSP